MSAKIIMITMVVSGILFAGCGAMSQTQKEREKRMQNSPQYKDGKFVNPIEAPLMVPGSTWKYIKKQFFTKLFISGDSGYFDGFRKIGEKLGPFEITFLKIGSYDEMWKQIHMTPDEAVQQHQDLGGSILVPLHWATFDLGLHPWYEPIERALASAENKDVQIITPLIGERVDINRLPDMTPWWRNVYGSERNDENR